jgi:hypothetical protein
MSLQLTMTAAVERGMRLASIEFAIGVIGSLEKEGVLTCSKEEAMKLFDFDGVSVVSSRSKASKKREKAKNRTAAAEQPKGPKRTPKPSMVLPFCGVVMNDWCAGVKFNHGLHTQCTQGRCKDDRYCKTCRKHADNSATGKPPYGDIEDRANYGVDYRDPKGKMTVPYANVAAKLNINLEAAHAAATTLSWTIPAEQLVKRVAKRGRPSKSAAVSDTDSESDVTAPSANKKRGRPSKAKVVKSQSQDDQIAQLVAEAYAETATTAVETTAAPKVAKMVVKKVKKPKMTVEEKAAAKLAKEQEKEQAKLAKKEAAEKVKAENKAAKEAEKEQAKLAKKEAAEKVKAEKKAAKEAEKALKEAAKLAKKEAAEKLKADKLAAKNLEKEEKLAAKLLAKADKLAKAKVKAAEKKAAKKSKTAQLKVPVAEVTAVVEEKTVVEEADLFLGSDDVAAVAQESVMPKSDELEFEEIDDAADSIDDEDDEGLELSETMTVAGVEYFFTEQDGQTILFTKAGEPVGIYDADTDTVQECEFDDE